MQNILLVALGGGLGASLRFMLSLLVNRAGTSHFNIGTLTVNLIGSLAIGLFMGFLTLHTNVSPKIYFFGVVGILGGFTTFSSFSYDAFQMLNDGFYGAFLSYFLISNVGGILLAFLGYKTVVNYFNI